MIRIELEPNRLERGDNRITLTVRNVSQSVFTGLTIRLRAGRNLFVDSKTLLTFARIDPGHVATEVINLSAVRAGSANLTCRCAWRQQNQSKDEDIPFTLEVIDKQVVSPPVPAKERPPSSPQRTPAPVRGTVKGQPQPVEPDRTPFRIQLRRDVLGRIEVRGLTMPGGGETKAEVELPFTTPQLKAILKALNAGELSLEGFKEEYIQSLQEMNLVTESRLRKDFHQVIGQKLYQALFSGRLLAKFVNASEAPGSAACQLYFDQDDDILPQFPWELIHDGDLHLVPVRNGVELTRYITFSNPPTPLKTTLPLKVLLISPRPIEKKKLPEGLEQQALLAGLQTLHRQGQIEIKKLAHPTWDNLELCLNNEAFDIIHFDGHGSFARACPVCQTAHYPGTTTCTRCQADMSDAAPEGYLHFEDDDRQPDPISIADLKAVLVNSQTRLMVLTACDSGVVGGVSIFNGIAPGLIQIGVPAVVGMQGSPPVGIMVKFVKRFYESVARGQSIPEAVNRGRLAIYRDQPISWFMPVVYLRSSDNSYGQLFEL